MAEPAKVYQFPGRKGDHSQAPREAGRSIQVEDGFTRTANPLVEAFARSPLTSREARVIRVVERMTYGWNKPEDWIAASVISEMTGLSEGKCSETLNALIRKRVLVREGGGRSPVRINKRIEEWDFTAQKARATPKRKPAPDWGESPQDGVTQSPQDGETPKTEDNLLPKGSKESSKKSKPRKWGEEIDFTLTDEMVQSVSSDLDSPIKHNPTTWANEFRLMRERDGRTVEQIRYLITWTAGHQFWSGVILSPAKLRAKWDQLAKQVKKQRQPARADGRKGFAQPKEQGTYTPTDMDNLPAWMRD